MHEKNKSQSIHIGKGSPYISCATNFLFFKSRILGQKIRNILFLSGVDNNPYHAFPDVLAGVAKVNAKAVRKFEIFFSPLLYIFELILKRPHIAFKGIVQ
jgi:hypothetical protein